MHRRGITTEANVHLVEADQEWERLALSARDLDLREESARIDESALAVQMVDAMNEANRNALARGERCVFTEAEIRNALARGVHPHDRGREDRAAWTAEQDDDNVVSINRGEDE